MADFRAIRATCDAIVRLLQESWKPEQFGDAPLQFRVYHTRDFENQPLEVGVILFLYRVTVNPSQRSLPVKTNPDGTTRQPPLPLDLHLMLTARAKEASLEQEILGWAMRTLHDYPILPAGLLNSLTPAVFRPDETVELSNVELTPEEMFRIWDVLPVKFQLSVAYLARVVRIDSARDLSGGEVVLERQLDFGALKRS